MVNLDEKVQNQLLPYDVAHSFYPWGSGDGVVHWDQAKAAIPSQQMKPGSPKQRTFEDMFCKAFSGQAD